RFVSLFVCAGRHFCIWSLNLCFFFSSRRRHTRSKRDWSSDVCSSDLDWSMKAVEMKSPVLPGYYADPNIIAFDDTYYIYATSDGYEGWGGDEIYVWESKDLVNWERGEEPFLELDNEDGNVPWSSGNGWEPTSTERDRKYY